jgi:hypothetical protein
MSFRPSSSIRKIETEETEWECKRERERVCGFSEHDGRKLNKAENKPASLQSIKIKRKSNQI